MKNKDYTTKGLKTSDKVSLLLLSCFIVINWALCSLLRLSQLIWAIEMVKVISTVPKPIFPPICPLDIYWLRVCFWEQLRTFGVLWRWRGVGRQVEGKWYGEGWGGGEEVERRLGRFIWNEGVYFEGVGRIGSWARVLEWAVGWSYKGWVLIILRSVWYIIHTRTNFVIHPIMRDWSCNISKVVLGTTLANVE